MGLELSIMVYHGPRWSKIVQNVPTKGKKKSQNSPKLSRIGHKLSKTVENVHTAQTWYNMVQCGLLYCNV